MVKSIIYIKWDIEKFILDVSKDYALILVTGPKGVETKLSKRLILTTNDFGEDKNENILMVPVTCIL